MHSVMRLPASAVEEGEREDQPTVRVRPVPAALIESTAARRLRLFWKSFTSVWRALVFTLPSMRMYVVFVLHNEIKVCFINLPE